METGDLLLFNYCSGILSYFLKYTTHSNYTHIGLILIDPVYIHPCLKGTFIWEATDDGMTIKPIADVLIMYKDSKVLHRKLLKNKDLDHEKLREINKKVCKSHYDFNAIDWMEAAFRFDSHPNKTDRFWCSALVGYIYTKLGILKEDTDWSILRPSDFSLDGECLNFINGYKLDFTEKRIL